MASRKRKLLSVLLGGIILLGVIAAAFPLWFPIVLRPVAGHFGVRYRDFLRVGKDKFALTDIRGKNDAVSFSASRVEAFLPWKWKSQLSRSSSNDIPPVFLLVNGWNLDLASSNASVSTNSPYEILQRFEQQVAQLNQWLPHAILSNGTFHWRNEELGFPTVTLVRGQIGGDVILPRATATTANFKADFSSQVTNTISIRVDSWDMRTQFRIVNQPGLTALNLTGSWKTNRLQGTAELRPGQQLPSEAHLASDGIMLPADLVKIEGFDSFRIVLAGDWKTNGFNIESQIHAQPSDASEKKRPEFNLSFNAQGNLTQATLVNARVFGPWLEARLDKPVTFDYKGKLETLDVPLHLSADMEKQSWLPVKGLLEGEAHLNPASVREPSLRFSLDGRQITGYGLDEATLKVSGRLQWPLLEISEGALSQTNGAAGTFSGKLNLESREVGSARFAFEGKMGGSLLPTGLDYQSARVSAEVSGSWPKLRHSGNLAITNLAYATLTNATLEAKWKGAAFDLESMEARLQTGTNHFNFVGALHLSPNETNVSVQSLSWTDGDRLLFGASAPFGIDLRGFTNSAQTKPRFPEVRVKGLRLAGQSTTVSIDAAVAWPSRGQVKIGVTNLNSVVFAPLFPEKVPEIDLAGLIVTAAWDQGPLQIDLHMLYNANVREIGEVTSSLDFQGDEKGLSVSGLKISAASGAIVRAEGTLPVTIFPAAEEGKRIRVSGVREVNFHADSVPNAKFWEAIGRWTGFYIQDPILKLDVAGKATEPAGTLNFSAREIRTTRIEQTIPHVENVRVLARLNASELKLDALDFSVEQQFLHASGQAPLTEDLAGKSSSQILDYLTKNATVSVHGADIQVAPFLKYLPTMIGPQGVVSIDATIVPPLRLKGDISVKGISTRPFESLGPAQDISASIRLEDRTVRVDNFSGQLAGESLAMTGTIDWSEPLLATGFLGLDLHISGKNIPLARRPDIILRCDIDLAVKHTLKSSSQISGTVTPRNSFFLGDLKFLVPGRLAKPRNRPPYFSIEQEPFADWSLDLRVKGDRFMKVRSPFFSGEVSSDFKIGGTLREPLVLGDALINSGFIQFPFANLEVKQGLVTFASDDPYLPKVFVTAGARAFGYELKLQVTGPANEPVIEFSSTPSLTSEEVVLMLTAGELPRHELTFSTQQRAGAFALFFGKSLWAKFGADESGAERLTVRSGQDVSEQGRQTYAVEYRLSKNWSLVGEYDRFSAVNAGVKWRLYSR